MGLLDASAGDAGTPALSKSNPPAPEAQDVIITEAAINEIRELHVKEKHPDNFGLRLGVKGGGCSGLSYDLRFTGPQDHDKIIRRPGVTVYIDPKSFVYLKGIQLDFESGLKGKGFVFSNPNASNTCGCGESFSV